MVWIKKDTDGRKLLSDFFGAQEAELRRHPEFDEILDEDKEALGYFREIGKLGNFVSEDDDHTEDSFDDQTQTQTVASASSSRRPRSTPGSAGSSVWSRKTTQSSLPPVDEEGSDDASPPKRLRLNDSVDRSISTAGHSQESIREESPQAESDESDSD